ncbi:MAG: CHAT domain-containing protein [Acidobacteriia bacterium]|nr:CHAT domain-containing protein [Terriglobia bacterium]
MPTLRISHTATDVEATLEGDGPRLTEKRPFSFTLSAQDAEDIRWYLEDYRIYPVDPMPKTAQRIERRMSEVGRELFHLTLAGSDVWAAVRDRLADTRIEVETELEDALVPWELLRDPVADLPLALDVPSFVRCHSRPALRPNPLEPAAGKIRILLVICRLEGDRVPFRSVARHLIRGLSGAAREPFHLEVLRPPTFEQLAKRLREAKAQGEPFHAVHFDGHGLSGEVFFENRKLKGNAESVKASELGRLLHETRVPLLILNACRSAASEPPEQPGQSADLHQQIRQFGSFAHAVMDYGASGVVAWRYSVFVDTAAQYMADLYGALASGLPLGEAATMARKQLRSAGRDIEDWIVPVVFEAAPVRLFPRAEAASEIKLQAGAPAESALPQAPDVGFIGRDETILQLDRTFDEQSIVLLHAYAGSGKTSTAVEFAGWYRETGGLSGPVLFTSFEQHKRLPQVLDKLGRAFEGALAKSGIQWLTLDDAQRRDMALQVLRQVPVLWIWDNVEPIAGFPVGTPSEWSAAEQKELADFLREARATKAKFLLTSRRDERDWLHELPARIELPPMPFDECVQMTEELAKKLGRRLEDVEDWRPLLRFTQGNPMTLTVLVGQALRDGLKSREQIARFVQKVQDGEEVFEDEASEGRTRSLAASLAYGFENAFTEAERKQLALLHLFQGFVHVGALGYIGDPKAEWCVPEVKGFAPDMGIELLERAAEVGLLTALGGGYYRIHPALPWFFRRLFEQYYSETRSVATRAFVEASAGLGNYYADQYALGNSDVVGALGAEEANLLHARNLARANGWWDALTSAMQGLERLYLHTGRLVDWSRLVQEIVPDFVDPATDSPLPGREDEWGLVIGYRVRLARYARRWAEAERLERSDVSRNRQLAASILARPRQTLDAIEKNVVRTLATSLHDLSEIQRERGSANCLDGYREALSLVESIQDSAGAAACTFNLGRAYEALDEIRDLSLAEYWFRRSLDLRAKEDRMGLASSLGQLGLVAYRRFLYTRTAGGPSQEYVVYLTKAQNYYVQALELFPANAVRELATVHNALGAVCRAAGQIDDALRHYRVSIRYSEAMQDRFNAGRSRRNSAGTLVDAGNFADARDWAQSALRDLQACENADQEVVKTLKILELIESGLQETSPSS